MTGPARRRATGTATASARWSSGSWSSPRRCWAPAPTAGRWAYPPTGSAFPELSLCGSSLFLRIPDFRLSCGNRRQFSKCLIGSWVLCCDQAPARGNAHQPKFVNVSVWPRPTAHPLASTVCLLCIWPAPLRAGGPGCPMRVPWGHLQAHLSQDWGPRLPHEGATGAPPDPTLWWLRAQTTP